MAIRKRIWAGPDGKEKTAWQVDYKDQNGKRRSKQFTRKKDAEAWATEAKWEVSKGVHNAESDSITVEKAVQLWLDASRAKNLESKTLAGYESTARLHIVPFLGKEKLAKLRKPTIEQFKDDLLAQGRPRSRVKRTISFLGLILTEMERRGLVATNVAKGVRVVIPKRDSTEVEIPEPHELRALLEHADEDFKPFLLTAMLTGMRSSELRGLGWDQVDFKENVIRVTRRADEQGRFGPPKSKAGRRAIPMSPRLAEELLAWKLRCPKTWDKLVFPSPEGKVWAYANLMRRKFWPLQIKAGVSVIVPDPTDGFPIWFETDEMVFDAKYSLHALRHATASLWIRQGVDLKRLKTWLGHSSVQLTIDRYGHIMKDATGDAVIMANAAAALLDVKEEDLAA